VKVIVTGRGTSASWLIRGEQLGAAIGATVLPNAVNFDGVDLAVIVKRVNNDLLGRIHAARVPVVWDIVDAWPQQQGNFWSKDECLDWLRSEVRRVSPHAIVAATEAMANDCESFGVPVLALPHHARPGLQRNPIREQVQTVGYEGGLQYLGKWQTWFDVECRGHGWRFVINPDALSELDIVVAVRVQDGYAPAHWKAGTKLANAQGSGTPCVVSREAGALEIASGAELWADSAAEFAAGLEILAPVAERRSRAEALSGATLSLEQIAATYRSWLDAL
jgi:hypothetical protein